MNFVGIRNIHVKSAVFNYLYLDVETVNLIVIAQTCQCFLVYNVEFQFQEIFIVFNSRVYCLNVQFTR